MKLDDSAIAHIAKTLQVAILTGTDIVDNLRQVEFVLEDDSLVVDPKCSKAFSDNLEKMLEDAEKMRVTSTDI